jgi:secreted trypsin-like serine protease
MTTSRLIRAPLWATLLIALVAAMVSLFAFVPSSEGATYDPQVINGEPVPNGKYPFMSFLTIMFTDGPDANNKPDPFQCGGSLIDADSVLTAAHCVTPQTASQSLLQVKVFVGRTVLNSNQGQVRFSTKEFVHPNWPHAFGTDVGPYDVAVLQLNRKVSNIKPIELATSDQNNLERPGRHATVAGWGFQLAYPPEGDYPPGSRVQNHMREAQVPLVSDSRAEQTYTDYIPPIMIAAGGKAKDTCLGDSGGPLFVRTSGNSGGKYTQIGIVSTGAGCGTKGVPGVYAEVNNPSIRSFITNAASK